MPETEFVRLEVDGAVGVIRLDRPPVNAINSQVHADLLAVAREAAGRTDIRAVVVYGGERAFAAGADIKEMAEQTPETIAGFGATLTAAVDAVARLPKPVIAAVTGYALGGGCELALAADFRVVADDARIGLPEITLGVYPGAGGTQRLPRLIGVSLAKELIFTGRSVTGSEAAEIGLANASVPAGEVFDTAMKMARRLAAGATLAIAAAKRAIDDGMDTDLAGGLEIESAGFAALFATADQKAGMRSFLQDGPGKATFTGA
ncbi:short chain enoyl-CoA hydratase [Nakamurella panacisegetis]|uniref:enoyl-CoA hydratase n=1 Tax=Nakamurella panacisegetis TaxID=1090615 RepID=A0A1H0RN96_9ACTN|nr:enoyl-CoA hydratase/isomerase family protein [Nakamurella panacisegetis]SDP30880.1 short chain enoyl-CoA hydratase [Nakamurella panacisegetis]